MAAGDPSTPITTGRPGPGVRTGPVGTSTTGQQAWAMTVRDLAPRSADVKAPCSARPSTSRLACRDASTMAPAAPPAAGKLPPARPALTDSARETPSSATARAWSIATSRRYSVLAPGHTGTVRVVHGGEHLQAGVPLRRGGGGPVDCRRGGGGAVVAHDHWLRAQRLAGAGRGRVAASVLGSGHAVTVAPAGRAPGQGRRSSAPARWLVVSRHRPEQGRRPQTAAA